MVEPRPTAPRPASTGPARPEQAKTEALSAGSGPASTTTPANPMVASAGACLVLVSCPPESAADLAESLVNQGLAACVQILPGVQSIYTWQGRVQKDSESLLLIKTRQDLLEALGHSVQEGHPYEVPEILAFPASQGLESYLGWMDQVLKTPEQGDRP